MLDTNTATNIIKGQLVQIRDRLAREPMAKIHISVITEAELLRGVAKKPDAKWLPLGKL